MSKVRRVYHLAHPTCYLYQLINENEKTKNVTIYSLLCDSKERVAKQIQSHLIVDCGLKYGICNVSKIETYESNGETVELYFVLVDEGNSTRTRSVIDQYTGKWVSTKNEVNDINLIEEEAVVWISRFKKNNMWTIYDFLACEDKRFEEIIKDFKIVNPD